MSELGSVRWWWVAGALALAHVTLMLGSFTLQKVAPLGSSSATVVADHVSWSMPKGFAGGYLTALSFLVFLVDATLLARLVRGRTEASWWWSSTARTAAGVYVSTTFVGLAALAGALYSGHHGSPVGPVTMLVDVHWFAIYLATAVLGLFTVAIGCAARVSRALPRWLTDSGIAVGAICLVTVPAARAGASDLATVVWLVWFVALAVVALRGPRQRVGDEAATPALVG